MIEINDIQAGEYELICKQWDEVTSEPGKPIEYTRHYQGETVTLSQADARRLYKGGAILKPGERQRAAAEAAKAAYAAALAQLPPDVANDLAADTTGSTQPAAVPGWWGDGDAPTTVEQITQKVGSNKALAAGALAAEYSGKARTTLIACLTAVLAAEGE